MAVSCQSISRLRSAGNSLDSNSYLNRSRRWRPPCLPRNESPDPRPDALHATKDIKGLEKLGWGTWIRTKIDGVRVRCSTVELSPTQLTTDKVLEDLKGVGRGRECLGRSGPYGHSGSERDGEAPGRLQCDRSRAQ